MMLSWRWCTCWCKPLFGVLPQLSVLRLHLIGDSIRRHREVQMRLRVQGARLRGIAETLSRLLPFAPGLEPLLSPHLLVGPRPCLCAFSTSLRQHGLPTDSWLGRIFRLGVVFPCLHPPCWFTSFDRASDAKSPLRLFSRV